MPETDNQTNEANQPTAPEPAPQNQNSSTDMTPYRSAKGLRDFINRAKEIGAQRKRGTKDAVLRTQIERQDSTIISQNEQIQEQSQKIEMTEAGKAEAERIARIDKLTGLPNRRGFDDVYERTLAAVQRGGPETTILVFDLDDLKTTNDTQGHPEGDRLIIEAATALRDALRDEDFLARTGGDEFVAILRANANDIRKSWDERIKPLLAARGVRLSAGASQIDPSDPTQALNEADKAMYGSKKEPRKRENLLVIKEPAPTK